ncbi:PREDICTED: piggyBac transposable element-derived protein 4-like [Priapulus caudatus]|uniref:PiggyBac transposable element-derived protein 4-like n=1 Tax=Priapulus caudatus TaxID=37621 RepID=A0ABM1EXF8_PRICU|nr:PREDICTED: piggyBac transposable element-derived protein 4-like [Priapulus caudatus]
MAAKRKTWLNLDEARALLSDLESDFSSTSDEFSDSGQEINSTVSSEADDTLPDDNNNNDSVHDASSTSTSSSESDADGTAGPNAGAARPVWKWSRNIQKPNELIFTGTPGIKVHLYNVTDPLEYFELYFDEGLIDMIVDETNRFAQQYIQGATLKPKSRARKWTPTNSNEIRVFLALLILQGIVHKPVAEWYWSTKDTLSTPYFASVMSVNRFKLLMQFLHFVDNTTFDADNDPSPKLFKLQPVLDYIAEKFVSVYTPEREISIDESLMLWKGRLGWKQYIPIKRDRFGIKSFELCESSSGYIWKFIVYTGKEANLKRDGKLLSTSVVLDLAEDLLDKGYKIYMDNFYSSPELAQILVDRNTDAVGTLRLNRKGNGTSCFTFHLYFSGDLL